MEGRSPHELMATGMGSQCAQPSHVHQLHAHLLVSGRLLGGSSALALMLLRVACRVRASPCLRPLAHHLLDHVPHPAFLLSSLLQASCATAQMLSKLHTSAYVHRFSPVFILNLQCSHYTMAWY